MTLSNLARLFIALATMAVGSFARAQNTPNAPPSYEDQRARMDEAIKAFPPLPFDIKVPHLDPARLSQALVDGTLNKNKTFAFVISHRGYHSEPNAGEHTPTSIMAAYRAGSDGIEIDVKISSDHVLVLGHDFTMGRETVKWPNDPNPRQWDPLSGYPLVDPFYANISKRNKWDDELTTTHDSNPRRTQMTAESMWTARSLDNFDNKDAIGSYQDHQMTLYEALYFIAKYAPMQVWIDVKGWSDVEECAHTIRDIREYFTEVGDKQSGANLSHVFFKLSYGHLIKTFKTGFPAPISTLLKTPGLYYFFVFAPNEADQITDNPDLGNGNFQTGYHKFCTIELGCVGNEFGYKEAANPVSDSYNNALRTSGEFMASFHNSPPYLWYWETQPNESDRANTWSRWYIRADGSCCADRYDVLGWSEHVGAETDDLRPSARFEETGYQAITTDDSMGVLRDLQRDGRRPAALISELATSDSKNFPTGGAKLTDLYADDGLYTITTFFHGQQYFLDAYAYGSGRHVTLRRMSIQKFYKGFWFLKKRDSGLSTLQSAEDTGQAFLSGTCTDDPHPAVALTNFLQECNPPLSLLAHGSGYIIVLSGHAVNLQAILDPRSDDPIVAWAPDSTITTIWNLTPIKRVFPELSRNTIGPAGSRYCAEYNKDNPLDLKCSFTFTGGSSLYYGDSIDFMRKDVSSETDCNPKSFDAGPDFGSHIPGCFYAPKVAGWISSDFKICASEGFPCSDAGVYKYYAYLENTWSSIRKVTYLHAGDISCTPEQFGLNGASTYNGSCWALENQTFQNSKLDRSFAFCSNDGEDCPFYGTGAIAFGDPVTNSFIYRTFTNGVHCSAKAFAADPAPGKAKMCFYRDVTLPKLWNGTQYKPCATEGAGHMCNVSGASIVAFTGDFTQVDYHITSEPILCGVGSDRAFMRDPAQGKVKSCWVMSLNIAQQAPPHFTFCAEEDDVCAMDGIQARAAFGANGKFVYLWTQKGSFRCNTDQFGSDPAPGVKKGCYVYTFD